MRPRYRGALEVGRGASTSAGRVNLINIIELEQYVRGVVVNESPAFFHVEALKAQATAARGYAASLGRYVGLGYTFDIVDSAASQVYRGVAAEHTNAIAATQGTRGLVASYQGNIISALYSSSFGGVSESNEWIFNFPSSQLAGDNALPYLRSIYDGEGTIPDFTIPGEFESFWTTNQLQTYDDCVDVANRFARWRIDVPASAIKARLPGRSIVTAASPALSSASRFCNACREPYTDGAGVVLGVIATGGRWGHNVGLSQYGAHGRGRAGQNFPEILNAYYTGVDIGSYPIDIGEDERRPSVMRPSFVAPTGEGTLEIRPAGLKGLRKRISRPPWSAWTSRPTSRPA